MAKPVAPDTLGNFDLSREFDTADQLTKTLAGTKNLATNPGLVQALMTSKATPEQSQAIDQFVTGLDAQKQVQLASTQGTKINLDRDQRSALEAMNVPYDSVLYTQQDATNDYASHLEQSQGVTLKRDANGNPIVDDQGNLQLQEHHKSSGWSFGRVFHDATHNPVTDIGGEAVNILSKGWNIVDSAFADQSKNARAPGGFDINNAVNRADEMSKNGYDASNPLSILAFSASGKAHLDTSGISNDWDTQNPGMFGWSGNQAVDQAEQFADSPEKFRKAIFGDPNLTPDAAAKKFQDITSSQQFQGLVSRVNSERANIGNVVAHTLGLDPVAHPNIFKYTSIALDVAASFALDPTAIGIGQISNLKKGQLAIANLADANGIASVLDKSATSARPFLNARRTLQGSVQRMVDYGNEIRSANAEGRVTDAAQISAKATAENPALATLLPDFVGKNQIQAHTLATATNTIRQTEYAGSKYDETVADLRAATGSTFAEARSVLDKRIADRAEGLVGSPIYKPVTEAHEQPFVVGPGSPLDTYDKAADYIISKNALLRLSVGRAAVESSLMPGAVSQYGLRALRGNIASWQAGRDLSRVGKATDRATALKNADPAKFEQLLDPKGLIKTLPHADNAFDLQTGARLDKGEDVSQGLASQERALTPAEKGLVSYNLRRYGSATVPTSGLGKTLGWASPTAVAARTRLAARRFTSQLPRDTTIDLMGSGGLDVVEKMAKTYLTKGDAALLRAQYAMGDGGTRTSIIQGLVDQLGHASGATRTQAGRDMLSSAKTDVQQYVHTDGAKTVNGMPVGFHLGQMRTSFRIPSFGEFQEHAAKIGLLSGTLGRYTGSKLANDLGGIWRLGAISQPRTAVRAIIESDLNAATDGKLLDSLRAKAALADNGVLQGPGFGRTRWAQAVANLWPVAKTGQFYRHILQKGMDPEHARIIQEDGDVLASYVTQEGIRHTLAEIDPLGAATSTNIVRDGLAPAPLTFDLTKDIHWGGKNVKIRTGYDKLGADGVEGATRYANALGLRVNPTPEVANAAIAAAKAPDNRQLVDDVVKALEAPAVKNLKDMSSFGKVYWKDGADDATQAVTPEQIELGKQQYAQQIIGDFGYLLKGRNGQFQTKIANYIAETGKAPTSDWVLTHLENDNRPTAVLAPEFAAKPINGIDGFVGGIQHFEGKLYQWMVERLIQRNVSLPMFAGAYAEEKSGLKGFQAAMADQLGEEAANHSVKQIAMQRAWERISLMVDDPQLRTQMDIVGRNFFAFSRATTVMIRRWGSTFYRNPAAARRMMLAWEGAVHSGMVYTDQNGRKMFTFPGSGAMMSLVQDIGSKVPFFSNIAMYPTADLTGNVTQIIPGSANPFQFSMSPMITVPMQKVTSLFPDSHQVWDEIDNAMNGPNSAHGGVVGSLTPTLLRGFTQALAENDKNSMLSSAMMGTIANLSAAGLTPPADATSDQVDKFLGQVKDGTRSALFTRAIFSPWLFASPSNVTQEQQKADYGFAINGVKSLDAEYKTIINDVGGDLGRAQQIFLALHPEGMAYTVGQSSSKVYKATLPATQAALDWMQQNKGFLSKYKSVGAYFMPANAGNEPFNMQAYQAQLELGLRVKKTPREFYNDVRVQGANNQYYAMQDKYLADKNSALAEGNTDLTKAQDAQWAMWKKEFNSLNPLFADARANSETRRLDAQDKLKTLTNMVNANGVPGTVDKHALANMIQAYSDYEAFVKSHPGTDNVTQAMHSQAAQRFNSYMSGVIAGNPGLAPLYNGVFRQLDSNLDTVQTIQGGG